MNSNGIDNLKEDRFSIINFQNNFFKNETYYYCFSHPNVALISKRLSSFNNILVPLTEIMILKIIFSIKKCDLICIPIFTMDFSTKLNDPFVALSLFGIVAPRHTTTPENIEKAAVKTAQVSDSIRKPKKKPNF